MSSKLRIDIGQLDVGVGANKEIIAAESPAVEFCMFDDDGAPSLRIELIADGAPDGGITIYLDGDEVIRDLFYYLYGKIAHMPKVS